MSNPGFKSSGVDSESPNITPPPLRTKEDEIEPMLRELPLPTPLVSRKEVGNGEVSESEMKVKVKKAKGKNRRQ